MTDPDKINMYKMMEDISELVSLGLKGSMRLARTSRVLAEAGFNWLLGDRPPNPVLLRKTFEQLGSTYIKLGQFIASSPSLFPQEYVQEFQHCLDQTKPIPFPVLRDVLRRELGNRRVREIFAEIDPDPIASASIAQVYAASLVSGEEVVIKIQKPGVRDIMVADMGFLFLAARLFERIIPGLSHASLADMLAELRSTMMDECDFIKEAENINRFRQFLKDRGHDGVVAPRVYDHATTRRVLTMERLYGIPFSDRNELLQHSEHPDEVLSHAFKTWFDSLTHCDFFHADLHAGNLMILRDGKVGFIDFGIVSAISTKTREAVKALMWAMMMGDYRVMAESMAGVGMTREKVDIDRLARDLENIYSRVNEMGTDLFTFSPMETECRQLPQPENLLLEFVRIGERHGIRFPREFTMLLKQFLYFDSYSDIMVTELDTFMEAIFAKVEAFTPEQE